MSWAAALQRKIARMQASMAGLLCASAGHPESGWHCRSRSSSSDVGSSNQQLRAESRLHTLSEGRYMPKKYCLRPKVREV